MKISKTKRNRFFLMFQGSFDPKIRFICQKVCSVARGETDRQTDTKENKEDTLSGFRNVIKGRSSILRKTLQFKLFRVGLEWWKSCNITSLK